MSRPKNKKKKKKKKAPPVDIWRCYLRDVRGFPLLDPEEAERLVLLIEEGRKAAAALAEPDLSPQRRRDLDERARRGREARDRVVVANLRLVIKIARGFARSERYPHLELLDLIQEGNVGLVMAVRNLESGRGKISTFVAPWIRRSIHRAVANQSRLVRLPVRVHAKLDRLRKEERWYRAWKGRPPTPEELAADLGIDAAELARLRQVEEEDVAPLQESVTDDETGEAYEDFVEDPRAAAFAQRTADRQWLARSSNGLPERSRRILELHFGHGLSLADVGEREDLTRERVRQIKVEALERLRR